MRKYEEAWKYIKLALQFDPNDFALLVFRQQVTQSHILKVFIMSEQCAEQVEVKFVIGKFSGRRTYPERQEGIG